LTKFADQLYEDLMREHGAALRSIERPAAKPVRARGRVARPAWVTAAGTATAGAVAAGLVVFGGGAAPAYAVTENPNGTLSVAVHKAAAIDAANARLKALGARVVVVPVRPGCVSLQSIGLKDSQGPVTVTIESNDGALTVDAKGIPAGETMVIGFDDSQSGGLAGSALIRGKAPNCVSLPAPGSLPPGVVSSRSGPQSGAGDQGAAVAH